MPELDGHSQLLKDLRILLLEAENREFHDFGNTKYAAPKVTLVRKLNTLILNVKKGVYDN